MMMTYTVCKVMFKGDPTDLPSSSSSAAGENEHDLSLIPKLNSNSSGGLSKETEVQNPDQITSSVSLIPHVNNNSGGLVAETEVEYRDRGGRSHQITSSISSIPHLNNNNSGGLSTETEVVGHFTTISFFVFFPFS